MSFFGRILGIFCTVLLLSLAMAPGRADLVEENESETTHVIHVENQFSYPVTVIAFNFDLSWPAQQELTPQYNPKKEPRPPSLC